MIKVERIPDGHLCVVCDAPASIEVSNNGSFKLYWACGPHDREIPLCRHCARKLKEGLDSIDI